MSVFELFRSSGSVETIIVVTKGDLRGDVLLRVNSACLTSEVFGDGGCDCAWQLASAFRTIGVHGCGLIIYCPFEEGRGAGIFAKVNALAHAERTGAHSSVAFRAIGLPEDGRDYGYVPVVLKALGIESVRMMTNNPRKVRAVTDAGIHVAERIEIFAEHRADLRNFFEDKRLGQGHLLDLARIGVPAAPSEN
jgi:GTP cyclohydrolase II